MEVPFKINVKIKCKIKKTWNQGTENFCSCWHYIQKNNAALHSKCNLVYLLYVQAECWHLALKCCWGWPCFHWLQSLYGISSMLMHFIADKNIAWCSLFPPFSPTFSSSGTLYVNLSSICYKVFALHLHHRHHLDNNNYYNQMCVLEVMWLLSADLS